MRVLGIESSCDETGVALVEVVGAVVPRLLGEALHSQVRLHEAYGGVVPELASRDHVRRVLPLAELALSEAGLSLADIDLVAFTRGPGLGGHTKSSVPSARVYSNTPIRISNIKPRLSAAAAG